MSIALPGLQLASLTVNQTTFIDLTKAGINGNPAFTQNPAHINVYNESGTGLLMTFDNDGASHIVPSGAWGQFDLSAAVTRINFQVLYNLPNPQVTTLYVVYFQPNEAVLPIAIRGNSPSVVNNATINGTLTVQGDATFNGAGTSVAVTNNETVGGTLGVTGASTFSGDIAANGAGTGLAVQNNETVGGTLVVTGDVTLNGATPSLTTANDITDNGNLSVNKNLNFIDNGANKRLFATNDGTTNDFIIVNNINHGLTHFRKSDALTDIFTMADTLAVQFFGVVQPSAPNQSATGSVSGSVVFFAPIWGPSLKIFIVEFINYNSVNVPQFVFPSAANKGWFQIGNTGGSFTFAFLNGVTGVNAQLTTALGNATTAGTTAGAANVHGASMGIVEATVDRINIGSTAATTFNTMIVFVGQ